MPTTLTGDALAAINATVLVHGADASGNYLGLVDQAVAAHVLFGPPPSGAGWLWSAAQQTWLFTPTLAQAIRDGCNEIDKHADAIYSAVVGARGDEYQRASEQAQAFAAALYVGNAPASVASWAQAKGQTARWAADSILQTAAQWEGAMQAIRGARLRAKEVMRSAATLEATNTAMAQYIATLAPIKTALGLS